MPCSPQVYVAIFLDPVIFHLTSAKSLQQIFWWKHMPLWVAGVIVAAIMVPLGQVSVREVGERSEQVHKACMQLPDHRRDGGGQHGSHGLGQCWAGR